ncbi:efflux RND transporter permease subunit, partial [Candidatus Riflebacteria bacterium]
SSVTIAGKRDREIWIEVDPDKIETFGISLDEITSRVRNHNVNEPGGVLKGKRGEYLVRTLATVKAGEDLQKVIIRSNKKGNHLLLKDIAKISDTFEERKTWSLVSGKNAMTLTIFKSERGDTINISNHVKKLVEKLKNQVPEGTELKVFNDTSYYIKNRLNTIKASSALGFCLVFSLLFLTMSSRIAFFTGMGIPFSFLTAAIFFPIFGITLNMISLLGLLIVLGLVVDDAIVVTENIFRYMEKGMPPDEAAIKGTEEVFYPVIATVLTTVAAFIPMLLMTGTMGKFMGVLPQVVSLTLMVSLFEALFILPCHMAEFVRKGKHSFFGRVREKILSTVLIIYLPILKFFLNHRYLVLVLLLFLTGMTVNVAKSMPFQLFKNDSFKTFRIYIDTPSSSSLADSKKVTREVEKQIQKLPVEELDNFTSIVGYQRLERSQKTGNQYSQITVEINEPLKLKRSGHEIMQDIRERINNVKGAISIRVRRGHGGPPVGKPVSIRVMSDNLETLRTASDYIKGKLRNFFLVRDENTVVKGKMSQTPEKIENIIYGIEDDAGSGKEEFCISIDEAKRNFYGIENKAVSRTVRAAYQGNIAFTILENDEEIDAVVKYPDSFKRDVFGLEKLRVPTFSGNMVPLSAFTRITRKKGYFQINRFQRKRTLTISAEIDIKKATALDVTGKLEKELSNLGALYPGVSFEFGGEKEDIAESLRSLRKAFILAIILIYFILGTLFNSFFHPFVVMLTVPFSFIGVIAGFKIMAEPLGLLAMVGCVALSGIVVNDSLILVDFVNRYRKDEPDLKNALIEGCKTRYRQILITTLTTVFGMMPLALGLGLGTEAFLSPLAIAITSGLSFATVVVLLYIPTIYLIAEDLKIVLLSVFEFASAPFYFLKKKPELPKQTDTGR